MGGEAAPGLFKAIFSSRILLQRVCTTPVWWITTTFVYYGLNINSVGLSGNMYLNYILVCAIEIPGLTIFLLFLLMLSLTYTHLQRDPRRRGRSRLICCTWMGVIGIEARRMLCLNSREFLVCNKYCWYYNKNFRKSHNNIIFIWIINISDMRPIIRIFILLSS